MWIWIGVLWLALGLWSSRILYNAGGDIGQHIIGFVLPPVAILASLATYGKACFKKGTKMEKVYWNEGQGQIMTKGGKCLYDKRRIESLERDTNETLRRYHERYHDIVTKEMGLPGIITQLKCSAKGHGDWVFVNRGIDRFSGMILHPESRQQLNDTFYFKCSGCGLEIAKTKKELKPSEAEALKKLKLL